MIPNIALELSIEQLIDALNEKLFTECTKIESTTPPVSRTRVATLAAEIDALEKKAKDILHKVICLRNPLQLVNRLFPQLIALCATFVSCTDPRPAIALTHVCRYWRRSIASSPRNWASIGTGWKRLVPLCLKRAGVTPLTVKVSVSDIQGDEEFLQTLLPHISRISDLSLAGYSSKSTVSDELPGFFASTMPHIIFLEVKQPRQPAELFPPGKTTTPPIFQNVSKLKSLHLTRVPLFPTLFNIPSLVELELANYKIHFAKFIGFLESNITLEIVILKLGFVKDSALTVPEGMASLPRLQHLDFTCDRAIDARWLFSCLSLPRGIKVKLAGSENVQGEKLPSFLPSPHTSIHELLTAITTIKFQRYDLHLFGNNGSFFFDRDPWTVEQSDYKEFDLFATGSVREFHLRPPEYEGVAYHLPRALKRLPALEALVISRATLPSGSLSALSSEPLLCRSLKTIALFNCDLSPDIITALEGIATKREHLTAARLYRVVIVNERCKFPEFDSIVRLRKLVPHVDLMVDDRLPCLL